MFFSCTKGAYLPKTNVLGLVVETLSEFTPVSR